jgi:hypothetical protein
MRKHLCKFSMTAITAVDTRDRESYADTTMENVRRYLLSSYTFMFTDR